MGVIPLNGTQIEIIKKGTNAFIWSIFHPSRKIYYLAASDVESMESWIHSINMATNKITDSPIENKSFSSTIGKIDLSGEFKMISEEIPLSSNFCILKENILYFLDDPKVNLSFS